MRASDGFGLLLQKYSRKGGYPHKREVFVRNNVFFTENSRVRAGHYAQTVRKYVLKYLLSLMKGLY